MKIEMHCRVHKLVIFALILISMRSLFCYFNCFAFTTNYKCTTDLFIYPQFTVHYPIIRLFLLIVNSFLMRIIISQIIFHSNKLQLFADEKIDKKHPKGLFWNFKSVFLFVPFRNIKFFVHRSSNSRKFNST
jgi:hypothetical protein